MPSYDLRDLGNENPGHSLPKDELREDSVLNDDGSIPDDQTVRVEKLGPRTYLTRLPDSGELPALQDCPVVRRLAGEALLDMGAYGNENVSAD